MCQVSSSATFRNYTGCDERQERWLLELLATASAVASGSENHKSAEARRAARSAVRSTTTSGQRRCRRLVANVSTRANQSTPRVDVVALRHARARRSCAMVARRGRRHRRARALIRGPRLRLRVVVVAILDAWRRFGSGRSAAGAAEESCAGGKWSARAREGRRAAACPACGSSAMTGSIGAQGLVEAEAETARGSTSAVPVGRRTLAPAGPETRPRSRCGGPGRTLEKFRARRACDKRQECSPVCIPPCFPR